jgi:MoxR-like ATPase
MDEIEKYTLISFFATHYHEKYKLADLKPLISFELPRGSINLANAAKCYAFIKRVVM